MNLNLINQAIQKGYISGVTFIDLINKEEFTISNRKELYAPYPVEDKLYVKVNKHKSLPNKTACIYKNGEWAEIIDQKKLLIEKAKKDYPVGTRYKGANDGLEYTVEENIRNMYDIYLSGNIDAGPNKDSFYYRNKWAEIVEQSTKINYNSLIKDEIYYTEYMNNACPHIFKYISGKVDKGIANKCIHSNEYTNSIRFFSGPYLDNLRIATTEEKKWLNVCIKADTFIPKENIHLYDDNTFELINSNEIKIGDWIYTLENSCGDGMRYSDENKAFKVLGYDQIDSNLLVLDPKSNDTTCTPGKITVNKRKVIKYDMTNKIIGYKCPMDLFGGVIIKNAIFTKFSDEKYVANQNYIGDKNPAYFMPKEIVEAWEPVYHKLLKPNDFIICIKDSVSFLQKSMIGKLISCNNNNFKFKHILYDHDTTGTIINDNVKVLSNDELDKYSKLPVINGYNGHYYIKGSPFVEYGCAKINVDLLFTIYKNNYSTNYRLIDNITTSNNVAITFEDIKKICTAIFIINNR